MMKKAIALVLALTFCLCCFAACSGDKNTETTTAADNGTTAEGETVASKGTIRPTNLSFGDSAEAYKNGTIDAFFCTAGDPTTAITTLATTNKFNLLSLDDATIDALIAKYPFYTKRVITAGTYSNITEDVQTVAVMATLIVSDKVDENTVYNLTKAFFESKSEYTHDKASFIDLETAVKGLGDVPVHPGAAKYYTEMGFTADKYGYTVAEADTAAKAPSSIRFTTGGDSGTYYAFGGVIANILSTKLGSSVVAQTSGGSKANIQAIVDGEAEMGWVQNDVMYYAYTGTDLFAGQKESGFSVIAAVYPETCQIVATTGITSVGDLANKTVSIGDAGSGVEFNAKQILTAFGLSVAE